MRDGGLMLGGLLMRKTQVSLQRRELIELMQDVNFGFLEHLEVRKSEPVLQPSPIIVRDIALGKRAGAHPARDLEDFELRNEVVDLFRLFDEEQNTTIDHLVIQAGLPLRVKVRTARAS